MYSRENVNVGGGRRRRSQSTLEESLILLQQQQDQQDCGVLEQPHQKEEMQTLEPAEENGNACREEDETEGAAVVASSVRSGSIDSAVEGVTEDEDFCNLKSETRHNNNVIVKRARSSSAPFTFGLFTTTNTALANSNNNHPTTANKDNNNDHINNNNNRPEEENDALLKTKQVNTMVTKKIKEEKKRCIICFGKFTAKHPEFFIPCVAKCNDAPVHAKCIFEWKETKANSSQQPSTCPLCRGTLHDVGYTPPDPLNTPSLVMFSARKSFVNRPVPRTAGVVRCYIKAIREESIVFGKTIRYELYLQAPVTSRYPNGPLPKADDVGEDRLLLVARKRGLRKGACFNSIIDITLDENGIDFDRKGANFVGCVKSSFSGLEHSVLTPYVTHQGRKSGFSYVEIGAVKYTQNRVGRSVGPRRMQVCLPKVVAEKENNDNTDLYCGYDTTIDANSSSIPTNTNVIDDIDHQPIITTTTTTMIPSSSNQEQEFIHGKDTCDYSSDSDDSDDDEDEDSDEDNIKWSTCIYRPPKTSQSMRQKLRKGADLIKNSPSLLYAYNKQPYWLEAIQAYSLDFSGRVTLPSNKNFQLVLEGEPANGYSLPNRTSSPHEISLQFGKVQEGNVEVYTLDLQWPLSPVQAMGICLSACVQKFACA